MGPCGGVKDLGPIRRTSERMRGKVHSFQLNILLIVAYMLVSTTGFASFDASFMQSSCGLLVNLLDKGFWRHYDNATWKSGESESTPDPYSYYDNQIICSIEMTKNNDGGDMDLEIMAEPLMEEWCYSYRSGNAIYKRPFAIQILARGQLVNGSYTTIGYGTSIGGTFNSMTGSLPIPESIAKQYVKVIFDVVLVFDRDVDTFNNTVYNADGTRLYPMKETDAFYSAAIRLSVKNNGLMSSYDVLLNGYYMPDSSYTDIAGNMEVKALPSVADIVAKEVFASGQTLDIATYSYSTNSIVDRKGGNISVTLSSSPLEGTGPFYLKHLSANGGTPARVTSHNSMVFYVYMTSDNGHSVLDPTRNTVRYDGSISFPPDSRTDYMAIPCTTDANTTGTKPTTHWVDTGKLSFSIPGVQMINNTFLNYDSLVSGRYTSNIFVNIIPDF